MADGNGNGNATWTRWAIGLIVTIFVGLLAGIATEMHITNARLDGIDNTVGQTNSNLASTTQSVRDVCERLREYQGNFATLQQDEAQDRASIAQVGPQLQQMAGQMNQIQSDLTAQKYITDRIMRIEEQHGIRLDAIEAVSRATHANVILAPVTHGKKK